MNGSENLFKFVKMAPRQGSLVLHRPINGKTLKIFLSESRRPRPLIFDT